jgi:hypothetical protein
LFITRLIKNWNINYSPSQLLQALLRI